MNTSTNIANSKNAQKLMGNMTLQTKCKRILTLTRTGNIFNLQDKCTRVQHDAARIVEGYLLDEVE